MQRRVHWTENETQLVCHERFRIEMRGEMPSRTQDLWRMAQQRVLKEPRWRGFNDASSVASLNKIYTEMLKAGKFSEERVAAITVPAPLDPSQVVEINGRAVRKELYEICTAHFRATQPPPPSPTLDSVMRHMIKEEVAAAMPALIENLSEHLAEISERNYHRIMKAIDPNYQDDMPEVRETMSMMDMAERARKPTVIVVNALPAQLQSLQKEFPQFDMVGVNDKVPAQIDPLLVVGFEKFMGKTQKDGCKTKYRDRYVPILGTASDAKQRIHHKLDLLG